MCPSFPFGIEAEMWDVIVLIPDHCLSIYFRQAFKAICFLFTNVKSQKGSYTAELSMIFFNTTFGSAAVI